MSSYIVERGFWAIIGATIFYMFQSDIKNMITRIGNAIYGMLNKQIIISRKENPKNAFAIVETVNELVEYSNKWNAIDGITKPYYKLPNGTYRISTQYGKFLINLMSDEIIISVFLLFGSVSKIQKFLDEKYQKYCSPDRTLMLCTSEGDRWSFPIFRRPRNIEQMLLSGVVNVVNDVNDFKKNEMSYKKEGHPYRRGYILCGPPGTGKTMTIEAMAIKHNMSVYMLTLNAENMTDTILVNLVSKVPPNSILAIEEIDKQLETISKNTNNRVSMGGLLTALDGPQRLNHGVIIVLTTNSQKFVTDHSGEESPLIRPGRIDRVFYFEKEK